MKNFRPAAMAIPILLIILLTTSGGKWPLPKDEDPSPYHSLLNEVATLVKSEYVEPVDPDVKMTGALIGLVKSLDQGSAFFSPEQTRHYELLRQGRLLGIGVCGQSRNGYFWISGVWPGSPAQKAGLQKGDLIKAVDGRSLYGLTHWAMLLALNTEKSQTLKIQIFREGAPKPEERVVQSGWVEPASSLERINHSRYRLRLTRIDRDAVELVAARMPRQKNLQLIIDLRGGGGGDRLSFQELTRQLLPAEKNMLLARKGGRESLGIGSPQHLECRKVVLCDASTVFYGELLAALFKKNQTALIGEKTSGLVSELKLFSLADGSSVLLTVGNFILDNQPIGPGGIVPTIDCNGKMAGELNRLIDAALAKK